MDMQYGSPGYPTFRTYNLVGGALMSSPVKSPARQMSILWDVLGEPQETSANECQSDRTRRLMRPNLPAPDPVRKVISTTAGDGARLQTFTFRTPTQGEITRPLARAVSHSSGLRDADARK